MAGLVIVGANHRSVSLSVRDQLFVDDADVPAFLTTLGLPQAMILSTCDRVEVWAWDAEPDTLVQALQARSPGVVLYVHQDQAALTHGFSVTAALDSLIIGEPHVPGQVKAAARLARLAGTMGAGLDGFLDAALATAKRIRNETPIGEGPVSIAAAACQVARDLHGDLSTRRALLIGAGDMGELVAESLLAAGLGRLDVTASRAIRAETMARSLNAHLVPFETLSDALALADIVVSAVGGRTVTLSADHILRALKARRRRPMFLVDCAIPGDLDPAVNRLDGAFLYDLADLERIALKGRMSREHAAQAAHAIVREEVTRFGKEQTSRIAVPALVQLRQAFEAHRQAVLSEPLSADEATRLLINRLLHNPSEVLKDHASEDESWQEMERLLKTLFRLE